MNLIIDIGNTFSKLILFNKNKISHFEKHAILDEEVLKIFLKKFQKTSFVMLSNVGKELQWLEQLFVDNGIPVIVLSKKLRLPITIRYQTPETLGVDRIALAAGAYASYPHKDVLAIDAGSCITYEFINNKGEYMGGAIAPGLQMRLKAMHEFTARLPLLQWDTQQPELIGKTTQECMMSGVVHGIQAELEGIIERYKMRYPNLIVIITGGDQLLFDKDLKSGIFADAYLLAKGMNFILNYNAD